MCFVEQLRGFVMIEAIALEFDTNKHRVASFFAVVVVKRERF